MLLAGAPLAAGCTSNTAAHHAPSSPAPTTTSVPTRSTPTTTAPALADGSHAGWVTGATAGASPSLTLELCDHLTGQAATDYARSHGMPQGAPGDHVDVDTGASAIVPVSPQAQLTIVTAAQVTGAPVTQAPDVSSFVAWVSQNLARKVEGAFVGPLFQVTMRRGTVTAAAQVFEP